MALSTSVPAVDVTAPGVIPPRPVQLRAGYVRDARRRVALVSGAALLALVAGVGWPGLDLVEAWTLEHAWEQGEPLDVIRVDVRHSRLFGVVHGVETVVVHRDATGERVVVAERFRGPWEPPRPAVPEARRDAATGRVLTSVGVAARVPRLITAAAGLSVLAGCALVLLVAARRRVHELSVARSAAERSEEVVLTLLEPPRGRRFLFEAPSREATLGGYRDSARDARAAIELRTRRDEPGPLLAGGERRCSLGLRTADGDILVIRDQLWPLDLTVEERARAGASVSAWESELSSR